MTQPTNKLTIVHVPVGELKELPHNPRLWSDKATSDLTTSLERYELVEPLVVNHDHTVLGGNFRLSVAKQLGYTTVPCVYVDIKDEAKARELALRLNKNQGEFDFELLAQFDETMLEDVGFTSEEIDTIFDVDVDEPDNFDLTRELKKLNIDTIEAAKGDIYQLGDSRLMVGDSTVETDILKLMNGEQADMCLTDPPFRLSYMKGGIRHGEPVTGFGAKRNRRYLETEELPEDFTQLWMGNIAKIAKPDFSIIVYEAWQNVREIWQEMEAHWRVRNMLIWHLPTRHQGFAAKYKFFSKYDIAMVGAGGTVAYNNDPEEVPLQEEYETALYATVGKPQWEGYDKGKRIQPTDHITFNADDAKHSGQGVIFGTKPVEILIPYIKVLTKRGDLLVEPFCGSGSTLIAAVKLKRRCYLMEKSPTYAEVAMARWEKLTGEKRVKVDGQE